MTYLLVASVLVMLASFVGVVCIWKQLGRVIERNLSVLVSFSAGVFLFISYQLGYEAIEHAPSLLAGILWLLAGVVFVLVLFRLLPAFHHHHDDHAEEGPHSSIDARRVMLSDAIHNTGDGIVLAAAFAIGTPLGIATTLSIFVHEIVQEISEFFVLRQAGYSVRKALGWNLLVSSTILIGALGGFYLFDVFEQIEGPLLGVSAGALLVVVFHDLIPHSVRSSRQTMQYARHLAWFGLGLLIMFLIAAFLGHSHEYEEAHDHDAVAIVLA